MSAEPKPIRTVCGWCKMFGREPVVMVDVPLDHRGLSHGCCERCQEEVEQLDEPLRSKRDGTVH